MSELETYPLHPIGIVRSTLQRRADAPMQGYEGAPDAWLEIYSEFVDALEGIAPGAELVLLTWLHRSQRDTLKVHPRGDPDNPIAGVFATRSPDRPNPIGLHRIKVLETSGNNRFKVGPLEAVDGTPVIDIKPVLDQSFDA